MMTDLITTRVALWCVCTECGIGVYGPSDCKVFRCRDHKSFYCLNGHSQYFPGKSDIEREQQKRKLAERERDNARRFLKTEEDSHRATRGHLTRVKKRIAKGVCPCCKRSFSESRLQRHIESKHPGWSE